MLDELQPDTEYPLKNTSELRNLAGELTVVHISLYCFKSFPVRIFHKLTQNAGVTSHAFFLKDSEANLHKPLTDLELDLLTDAVEKINPGLITISILALYVPTAVQVVNRLRTISKAPIITGGKFPTVDPAEALKFSDYACKGEGELVLLEVYKRMKLGENLQGITGLWHHQDGEAVDCGQQPLIQDMDLIPTPSVGQPQMYFIEDDALTMADPEAVNPVVMMMAGLGCVYQCTFCVNSLLIPMNKGNGKFIRVRSPEATVREVEERLALLPPDVRDRATIYFVDEVFGVFKEWTDQFVALYKKRVNRPFFCEMIPKLIKEENIKTLVDAGLWELNFGIQSGNDELRRETFRRPGANKELVEKAKILTKHGVIPRYDIILENPFETAEMLSETLWLLDNLPHPMKMNVFKLQFFPHYPLTMEALKRGFISEKDLTHEVVAKSAMTNWSFQPKPWTADKKEQFENAIFLLGWADNFFNRLLCRMFNRMPVRPLALAIGLLALSFYRIEMSDSVSSLYLRRLRAAFGLLRSARFGELYKRTLRVFSGPSRLGKKRTHVKNDVW